MEIKSYFAVGKACERFWSAIQFFTWKNHQSNDGKSSEILMKNLANSCYLRHKF